MSDHLATFKRLSHDFLKLALNTPDLELSLDHRLQVFFPKLAQDSCIHFLHVNQELSSARGQAPVITSQSLYALIDQCCVTRQVPTFVQGSTHVYNLDFTLDERHRVAEISLPALEKYLEFVMHNMDRCVEEALTAFWQTPSDDFDQLTPKNWLSHFTQQLILAEAALRLEDKTLDSQTKDVIDQAFAPATGQARPIGFYTVSLTDESGLPDVALNGVFVVTDNNLPMALPDEDETARRVVLYTPANGLEAFDSLKALIQELSERLDDRYHGQTLLAYTFNQDRANALSLKNVQLQPANPDFATFYSSALIEKQMRDVNTALTRERPQTMTLEQLSGDIDDALTTGCILDPGSILRSRNTRLLESQLPTWLKTASDTDKTQWRLAVERMHHEWQGSQMADSQPITEAGQRNTLLGYARLKLKQSIKADHGLDVDPDDLFIVTTEALKTGPLILPGGSGFAAGVSLDRTGPPITYHTTRRTLSELALANVGVWDTTFALTARVTNAAGVNHPILTSSYVKALVRELDIGAHYQNHLKHLLIDSEQAKWRKDRYIAFYEAQLRLDLLEATLAGTLTGDQAAWIQAALAPHSNPLSHSERITVNLLMLRYKPLPGVLVFSSSASKTLLCYTPCAPENLWFLVAHSHNELGEILSRPSLRQYVLNRVTALQQAYIKPLLEQGLTDANLQLQPIRQNVFEDAYLSEALYAIRDADEQSTSTWESNLNTAKETALFALDVISFVLPFKVLLPIVLVRFVYHLLQGIDALQRDEQNEALLQFMESITHLTDAASDFAGSSVFTRSIRQRARQPHTRLNPSAVSPRSKAELTLVKGERYDAGVYEYTSMGHTSHYLADSRGNLYRAQYDHVDQLWRVLDMRNPAAPHRWPVSQISQGLWDVVPATTPANFKPGIDRIVQNAIVDDLNLTHQTPDIRGVYHVNQRHYITQNNVVFEVVSNELEFEWFLQVPGQSSRNRFLYKVRFEEGQWKIKHRLQGVKKWEPLINNITQPSVNTSSVHYSPYDIPNEHKSALQYLISKRAFDNTTFAGNPVIDEAGNVFMALKNKLYKQAQDFLATAPVRPRFMPSDIPADVTPGTLLDRFYEHSQGVVIGEMHAHVSPKKFLIDQMPELARRDVKVLYLEHLQTDMHQAYLDDFFSTGILHPELDLFLQRLDRGQQLPPDTPYTYSRLVREARARGVQVKAIDCAASAYPQGIESSTYELIRQQVFSYFATHTIRAHQAQTGGHKWIALTGNAHSNTHDSILGLAELEGAIGLHVRDVAPGFNPGLRKEVGMVLTPDKENPKYTLLKSDYWLEVATPGAPPKRPVLSEIQLQTKLGKIGAYTFESAAEHEALLIHRSNNNQLMRTPIKTDYDGKIFIERDNWPQVHNKRYPFLHHLMQDLRRLKGLVFIP